MVIIFSDNYRLSTSAATATIVWASSLVTTYSSCDQPAENVNIYWTHKIMSLSIILKYWTVIHRRRIENFRYNNIRSKLKPYCRHDKFKHNFGFLIKKQ